MTTTTKTKTTTTTKTKTTTMKAKVAKPLMVQGTMSGVGKSLLVAGLCRIFRQDGYRVAPFKSQNMALNSYICEDGAEIGRAQAMQAEAAGVPPCAAMNPVLLKPTNDVGSQVIVEGRPIGTMPAREYFAFKTSLIPRIRAAYDKLAAACDIVVIEGAGSPAEINLKQNDIVNMGMAKLAASPVLLVGDIDCGGVFAQLIGTHMLLDDDERPLVKATVINKFRGDRTILDLGVEILRERMGIPVAGVVPHMDLDLEEEDSFSGSFRTRTAASLVDIAVVRLPHMSNFSDFSALDAVAGVGVRYVTRTRDLGMPDLVVLPGTKSTIADLRWLRESGLEAAVLKANARGVPVFGICGGYQMLGEVVEDPDGAETEAGEIMRGMGLLPVRTRFGRAKRQVQSRGTVAAVPGALAPLSGVSVEGYEIHMGATALVSRPLAASAGGANAASAARPHAASPFASPSSSELAAPVVSSGSVDAAAPSPASSESASASVPAVSPLSSSSGSASSPAMDVDVSRETSTSDFASPCVPSFAFAPDPAAVASLASVVPPVASATYSDVSRETSDVAEFAPSRAFDAASSVPDSRASVSRETLVAPVLPVDAPAPECASALGQASASVPGQASASAPRPFALLSDGSGEPVPDGCCCGNVYGTYLHGVFDSQACAQALISALLEAKGLGADAAAAIDLRAYKESQYDKLADTLRASLDMNLIYDILEAGL